MYNDRFEPGHEIVLRRIWNGKIYRVTTAIVVQDTADLVAIYWGTGYPLKVAKTPLLLANETNQELKDAQWGGGYGEVIMLATPGAAHVVCGFRSEEHKLLEWYINLQEPLKRTADGFDTTDYLLDISVNPERTKWRWQDEEEFDQAIRLGNITREQADFYRTEGENAIRKILTGSNIFYSYWENWIPPTEWKIPKLPLNWDKI
ncbi:DUF402 domain-containing protein [Paenibacillus hemerocallicola]|uniref:DUF402 domain-containing protein n=1 Tax=Paenibacillus hemerocallicola TaxID=1172614 RepID=A0A5C4T0N8_9BACL|nr:DUF402 domain-containing protein [Paenibacillus hemerocallicola]TNJ61385.1 DUF402 domain-containing protein [Paenibacillus hemerocallicola]